MPLPSPAARTCAPVAAATCAVLLLAQSAGAQAADTVPYRLGEIVVSAEKPVSEAAATVREVTAADIREAGARTLDEAVALLPGVHVRTGGDGVPRVDVRGFRPRHLLLLLDGVPLNSSFDGQFDPTLIPVEQIASIKITAGPSSVLYGEGPLAGTINVITRGGAGDVSGELATELRERAGEMVRATAGGGSARLSAFGSVSALRTDGYTAEALDGSGDALRLGSDRKRVALFGSVSASPSDELALGLVVSGVHGAYGIPASAITDDTDPFASRPTYERVPSLDQLFAQLAASFTPAGPVSLRAWAYVNRYEEDHNRYDDSTFSSMSDSMMRGSFRESSRSRVRGIGLQAAVSAGSWGRLTLGLTGERDYWHSALHVRDVPLSPGGGGGGGGGGGEGGGGGGGGTTVYAFRDALDTRQLDKAGVALEYELHPAPGLGVTLGAAHHWLEKDSAGHDDAGSYTIGAFYDLTPRTRVRAAAARKVRFPAIRQLYDPSAGNPALHSEHAQELDVGVDQQLPGRSTLSVTGFRTEVNDFIERPAQSQPFANFDEYLFTGLEVTAETRAVARLLLRAGYTFLDTHDESPGSNRGALQYEPRHKMTLESRYAFPFGLRAALSLTRVAGQVYYSRVEPVQQASLPDYTLVALRLAQQLRANAIELYAGATNLFDAVYQDAYGFPQAGRTLYGGVALDW